MASITIDASAAARIAAEIAVKNKMLLPEVIRLTDHYGKLMQSMAKALAPVTATVPGYANTIERRPRLTVGGISITIESRSPFGYILEFGAGRSGPHPHFGPALQALDAPWTVSIMDAAAKVI
jgi:hypothetical protein